MQYEQGIAFAKTLDAGDPLAANRKRFLFPKHKGNDVLYFCGNSLGLQPIGVKEAVLRELDDWAALGVEGHLKARKPWFPYHEFLRDNMASVVGALPRETVVMNSLTANLHLLMVSFYRPTAKRYKILCEWSPFPSDRYVMQSQAAFHATGMGFDPEKAVVELKPPAGSQAVTTQQVLDTVASLGDSLALVLIGGVNYYTGQLYDMEAITRAAHKAGAMAGFDLAHAAGNVELKLHDWNVDFAAWCSYKYLNGGPGGVGAAFIHERHGRDTALPRFAGWWGNDPKTRFTMPEKFVPVPSADAWQLSNAPVLPMAVLNESLKIFAEAGMNRLRAKSAMLTGYLEYLVKEMGLPLKIITPSEPHQRGCQLSFIVTGDGKSVHAFLEKRGVITDWREPDVLRAAPVPLYNSFEDVYRLAETIREGVASHEKA
jgi:kynureninase